MNLDFDICQRFNAPGFDWAGTVCYIWSLESKDFLECVLPRLEFAARRLENDIPPIIDGRERSSLASQQSPCVFQGNTKLLRRRQCMCIFS